jgi:threonine aldolase
LKHGLALDRQSSSVAAVLRQTEPSTMNDMSRPKIGPDFRSDNVGSAAPEIVAAIAAANRDTATGYGGDEWSQRMNARFSDLFETKVRVWPVATGTAANAIALASVTPSHGAVMCADIAHINTSETNAVGFFSGGAKLSFVNSQYGKISAASLEEAIAAAGIGLAHRSQPAAVNIVQASDLGAVYSIDEVAAIGAVAKRHKLKFHMDGARFANAVATLGCKPADVTWRAGIDIMSFGMTKNGGLLCDAIVTFGDDVAPALLWHVRRAGHVWSKGRFAAAQALACVEDDLWLRMARNANAMARRIDEGLRKIPGIKTWAPVQANEVFLDASVAIIDALEREGVRFFRRAPTMARFVCRFDCTAQEVDDLLAALTKAANHG